MKKTSCLYAYVREMFHNIFYAPLKTPKIATIIMNTSWSVDSKKI